MRCTSDSHLLAAPEPERGQSGRGPQTPVSGRRTRASRERPSRDKGDDARRLERQAGVGVALPSPECECVRVCVSVCTDLQPVVNPSC